MQRFLLTMKVIAKLRESPSHIGSSNSNLLSR